MPHQMNNLSVQGPPIVTKSLLNHSSFQTTNKALLSGMPAFSRSLLSVVVKGCVLGLSLCVTASKKRNVKFINLLLTLSFLIICEIVTTGCGQNEIQFNIHFYASCLNCSLSNQILRNGKQLTRSYLEV